MKLLTVRIQNYKSIDDTGEFKIDEITCLVGKNEAGKSAILQALYKLNPTVDSDGEFDPIIEYPAKRRAVYNQQVEDGEIAPDTVVTSTWELEPKELEQVQEEFGESALIENKIIVTKGYDNQLSWRIPYAQKQILQHKLSSYEISPELRKSIETIEKLKDLLAFLIQSGAPTEEQQELYDLLKTDFPKEVIYSSLLVVLRPMLPKFLYFPVYDNMPGKVAIDDLTRREKEKDLDLPHLIFLALLRQAGVSIEQLQNAQRYEELRSRLEGAQSSISDQIFEYWSQNSHLQVKVAFDHSLQGDPPPFNTGYVIRTRIENTRHRASVDFDERSTGFVWFFSFLVWFSEVKRLYKDNLILLLDEPGLSLHGKAQLDLLRYFNDKLRPFHQVIYSTHSPWMIDGDYPLSIRTVEDVVEPEKRDDKNQIIEREKLLGTKVGDKIWSNDPDTIFPMQAYTGWETSQFFFVGKYNLLVEGPSEILYLNWFSKELRSRDREFLDKRWILVPVEGIDKIFPFVSLFAGNKLDIAILVDYAKGVKRKIENLEQREALEQGRIFRADIYAGQEEADIEDILGRNFYIDLVASCYGLSKADKLPKKKPESAPLRVVKEVENHLRVRDNYDEFNHYTPSSYLFEYGEVLKDKLSGLDEALSRFEKLFTDINKLLP